MQGSVNEVETVPSNIRKNYHLEKVSRGKQCGKFFFGFQIAALNFRKLFNICEGSRKLYPKVRRYATKYEFFKVL